jgi:hypothetical protein
MAQPHKGPRRRVAARMPESLMSDVLAYAESRHQTISDAVADLTAIALGKPLPSETLPKPKTQRQLEELPLAMSA